MSNRRPLIGRRRVDNTKIFLGITTAVFLATTILFVILFATKTNNVSAPITTAFPTAPPTPQPTIPPPTAPTTSAPTGTSAPTTSSPTSAPTSPAPTPAPTALLPPSVCVSGVNCTTAIALPAFGPEQGTGGGSAMLLFNTDTNVIYRWSNAGANARLHTIDPDTNAYSDNLYTNPASEHPLGWNAGAAYDHDNQIMYVCDDNGDLYTFDPFPTPTYVSVGTTPLTGGFFARQLAYRSGFLYTIELDDFVTPSGIVKIDPSDASKVGSTVVLTSVTETIVPSWQGLTMYRPSDTMYTVYKVDGASGPDRRIGTIDLDTGIINATCARHMLATNSIAMGTDGRMWLNTVIGGGGGGGGGGDSLYRVDDRPCNI